MQPISHNQYKIGGEKDKTSTQKMFWNDLPQ